jgi:hypothetical protein
LLLLCCLGIGFHTGMMAAVARSGASARWLEDRPPAVALEQGRGGPPRFLRRRRCYDCEDELWQLEKQAAW